MTSMRSGCSPSTGSGSMLRPAGMPNASRATMLAVGRTMPPPMIQRRLMRRASSAPITRDGRSMA
jgi:hypothetical protein